MLNSDSSLPCQVGSCSDYGPEGFPGLANGIAPRRPREVYRAGVASKCDIEMYDLIRGSRLEVLDNAGHHPHDERADDLIR
jgi:pimeloyl-ACP methyl ester carboxylesterase